MDGEIEFTFFQLTDAEKPTHKAGAAPPARPNPQASAWGA